MRVLGYMKNQKDEDLLKNILTTFNLTAGF